MNVLDLFCCGGGASKGLSDAGFDVVGVDVEWQPHYPFPFWQLDALTLPVDCLRQFDFIWASPPCQLYTRGAAGNGTTDRHKDLIAPTRELLMASGVPFVIENVPDAPLRPDLFLCGSMFGLQLIRHRIFELHGFTVPPLDCGTHHPSAFTVTGNTGNSAKTYKGTADDWRRVMGIDWLPASKVKEAVPPVYASYIGRHALTELEKW